VFHSQRLPAVRALRSALKPKPVYKRGDAAHQKVGRFYLRNGVFSLGHQAPLSAVSEDGPVLSAALQS
jgi:hypothetical protein